MPSQSPIAAAILAIFYTVKLCLIVRIVLSWIDPNPFPHNELKKVLWTITDPILKPLRAVIPPIGMIDVSPIVAFFLLELIQRAILSSF